MINNSNNRYLGRFSFIISHISFSVALGVALAACSDWDDHYDPAPGSAAEGITLWQQIKSNPQLSDFSQVLEQTKVYRMHKKSPVSYADLLASGQVFTVMAPVNGTFNKDSLLRLTESVRGDSAVERSFVKNHISRSLSSLKSEPSQLFMLNMKRMSMGDGKIEGVDISAPNGKASNGVLHILSEPLPYQRNIYEQLCDDPQLQEIGTRLSRFNEDYFDPDASVSNGVVDGVPIYVDSVVYEINRLIGSLGQIQAEDSNYVMVVPTADGWRKAYEEASQYFVFDEKTEKRDSLQQLYTMRALLEDAVFNMTEQQSIADSLVSVPYRNANQQYEQGKQVYHLFRSPFEPGGILYGATALPCSNGTIYTTPEWSLSPYDTYFKELYVEGESTHLIINYEKCVYNVVNVANAGYVSNNKYLRITPGGSTDNWTADFQVNNTLSGSYDIYAIVLPHNMFDDSAELRPYKFKASISCPNEKGNIQTTACVPGDDRPVSSKTEFTTWSDRVDTVLLARDFKFPTCNYGQSNMNVSIRLQCSITARQTSQYYREMWLDCIYLRPHNPKSEEQ